MNDKRYAVHAEAFGTMQECARTYTKMTIQSCMEALIDADKDEATERAVRAIAELMQKDKQDEKTTHATLQAIIEIAIAYTKNNPKTSENITNHQNIIMLAACFNFIGSLNTVTETAQEA